MTKAIPEKYHTLTPSFTFKDSAVAIEFYKKAFNAVLVDAVPNLNGKGIMHASMLIGNSMIMMGDEMPSGDCSKSAETVGTSPISLYIYVEDADAAFDQAVKAGGISNMPLSDMFWGDRIGQIKDPFGYLWSIATRKKDVTKEEVLKGAKDFFDQISATVAE